MLKKKEVINLYILKQKCKPYPATISNWLQGSKYTDIQWKNKITEIKSNIKKFDEENKIIPLNYKDVWRIIEEVLIEQ